MNEVFTGIGIGVLIAIFILYIIPMVGSIAFTTILWRNERDELKNHGWIIGLAYLVSFMPTINIFVFFILWFLYGKSKE